MATRLGLVGWVRNRSDGTVEAVFQGTDTAIKTMLADCNDGPIDANVTSVDHHPCDAIPETDFTQRPTL